MNPRFLFLLSLVWALLFSCSEKENNTDKPQGPKVVEARGYVVPKDSMAQPTEIPVDYTNLEKIAAGKPKMIPAGNNVFPAGQAKVVPVGMPRVTILGTDSFTLPKMVRAIDKPFLAKQPKPVAALPFRMKDDAICNIQYLDVDQGMISSTVWSMLKDKYGNLWFGTKNGLSRYNGKSFTHYTKKEGLKNNIILSIIEDKSGNIWFGTRGGGVTKYDGKSFTNYTQKEGLNQNTVYSIFEDKYGNIWFGTFGGGVIKYDGKFFTNFTIKEGLSNNIVVSIFEDKNRNLWFGTEGGGVSKYDGNRVEEVERKIRRGEIVSDRVQQGLYKVNGKLVKSFTHYSKMEGLSDNFIESISEDHSGNLWFGTAYAGVCKYDGNRVEEIEGQLKRGETVSELKQQDLYKSKGKFIKSFTHYTEREGLSNNTVFSIIEDKDGSMWFGTYGGGLSKYDGKSFTHFSVKEGLSNNAIRSILEDQNGNIWFGTLGGGVSRYVGQSFVHFTDQKILNNFGVRSMLEDRSGNLWFGTAGGGVSKYDGNRVAEIEDKIKKGDVVSGPDQHGLMKIKNKLVKSFTYYTKKEGLSDDFVFSILEDKTGNYWISRDGGGVSKYDGKSIIHFTENEGLSKNDVSSILEDKSGNLWFGTDGGGVNKYNGKSFTNYTKKEGLSSNFVISILEDKAGNLWFGTLGGGVSKYDGKSFTHYTDKEGLSNNTVISILEDKSGNLWFGTDGGGVSKYDGKFFTLFTEKEGLSNNTVRTISEDKSGNLWLGTDKGLNYLLAGNGKTANSKPQDREDKSNPKIVAFHKEDGLKAEGFSQNAVLLDSKNQIWLGSGKGLSMLDLNSYVFTNHQGPQVQLDQIYLKEKFVDYRNIHLDSTDFGKQLRQLKFSEVQRFQNYPRNLELPYEINHLTFEFSALDWYAPHKIKYQYKLEGLDKDWNNLTAENSADYRNIPSGKFTFKVKAIGSANKWSKTLEYTFTVHPPWWRTWWAYAIYLLLAITGSASVIRWRESSLKTRQKVLESKVAEATGEIRNQKEQVEQQKEIAEKRKEEAEQKNRQILDSIEYAKRIQSAILPTPQVVKEYLRNSFILYLPKDIVAGDFYWMESVDGTIYFAACDCTGHGVPGAMVSVVCHNALNRSLHEHGLREPGELLTKTAELVSENFDKSEDELGDGMEASLCAFQPATGSLRWAGANLSLWIYRKESQQMEEIRGDKQRIGRSEERKPFQTQNLSIVEGDVLYLFTDGYADQFGGARARKLTKAKFKELLLQIAEMPMEDQKKALLNFHNQYRGGEKQVDDICVIGVKVDGAI